MKMKQNIPVFIVEEHHEAFIAWNYAIRKHWMPDNGNCLFHVDAHSDMGIPRFNESINDINNDIDKVKNFTYNELNIGCFIIPACYQGVFNQVFWIKQKHKRELCKSHEMYVRSYNQSGKRLISGKIQTLQIDISDSDKKTFDYILSTIDQLPFCKKVVLDIDLDYFSCSGNPNELEEIHVEITQSEYNKFLNDPYSRLNYVGINKIEAVKKDDRYYYVLNRYNEQYPTTLKVDNKTISNRINEFVNCLNTKQIIPVAIDICRSRFSGYTPCDQWDFIEKNLLAELHKIFNIEQTTWN
jgi:hypothetical protein